MFLEDEYDILSPTDFKISKFQYEASSIPTRNKQKTFTKTETSSTYDYLQAVTHILQNNKRFYCEHFSKHQLFLCEAFCLLWINSGNGFTESCTSKLHAGTFAAFILDLYACRKIDIISEKDNNNLTVPPNRKCTDQPPSNLYIQVLHSNPTYTMLDRIIQKIDFLFKSSRSRSLDDWFRISKDACSGIICVKNLISRGILGNPPIDSISKYPIINFQTIQRLEGSIKAISLNQQRPDSYTLSLLTLAYHTELNDSLVDSILEKHLTRREIEVAKENINTIVSSQGRILKSPKFSRKRFSAEIL